MGKAASDIHNIYKKVYQACVQATMNSSDDIQSTGRDAVREWRSKVDFGENLTLDTQRIEAIIKPKGRAVKIFGFVDLGTKPHVIMPRKEGGMLKFRVGYSARTMPVAKYNVGTGQSFGSWATKAMIFHPGTKPRKFLETFMKELIPSFQVRVQQEITRAIQ